ncbi:centrosomal protein of 70 kDa-like [Dendronephthya gigantea]|uniref:centrosomal protein of 70 kDa-like n=1 Tax=Dendronephthya gigantea TaxID=151771 RepID=UPI00106A03C1|nr:centrosomal protein of 70 kDa-like [Dendronephthya gigantea]
MASSAGTDDNDSVRGKINDWQESSQATSSPTDNSKQVSGTDADFLENSNDADQRHNEYFEGAEDWTNVNNRLKQHGFRSIRPTPPSQVSEAQSGVFLDEAEAHMLRNTIEKLLDDCERRQALVQELITSSNKLQEEVNEKSDKAYRYDREVGRLRKELKSQQSKIQELEQKRLDEVRSHGEEMQATSIAKADLQANCDLLEQRCVEMEQKIVELQYQNQELVSLEKERQTKTSTFPQHRFDNDESNSQESKASHAVEKDLDDDHPIDQDSPTTASELDDMGRLTPKNLESTPETLQSEQVLEGKASKISLAPNSKFLQKKLKTTERHVEESKKLIDLLEDENNKLKAELTKRPGLDEWRKAWKYNKKLERILMENNLSISTKRTKDMNERKKSVKHKTHVKDIDFLPIDVCRKYIKRICTRLNINDLREINPLLDSLVTLSESQKKMEALIRKILQVIDVKNVPYQLLDDISDSTEPRDHSVYCEKAWKLILPTLKKWSSEIKNLKAVKEEITRLSQNLFPWKPVNDLFNEGSENDPSVEDIRKALEKITMSDDRVKAFDLREDDPASMEQLKGIVAHFQKLFDVKSISGVFPRMNEVYTRVGETLNVMKTIRETLDLAPNANSIEIVNAIGKIQTAKHYLKFQDLPGIIKRLEEYDEFFPAFQSLVSQLYDLLGVDKMDEILTAVKALIHFPQK